jgi:hypothetical protein
MESPRDVTLRLFQQNAKVAEDSHILIITHLPDPTGSRELGM